MRKSTRSLLALLPLPFSLAADAGVNALQGPGPAWSPYAVGAGIGILSWLTFYVSNKPIGAASFYAHVAGFLGKRTVETWGDLGKLTLPDLLHLPLKAVAAGVAVALIAVLFLLERIL